MFFHFLPIRNIGFFEYFVKGADIDGMTNLSAKLREKLNGLAVANPVRILESYKSKLDETEKFLYALTDGNLIEVGTTI